MTPTLRFLERWLRPGFARLVLSLIYTALLIAVIGLAGYNGVEPILYLNVQ